MSPVLHLFFNFILIVYFAHQFTNSDIEPLIAIIRSRNIVHTYETVDTYDTIHVFDTIHIYMQYYSRI